MQGPCLDTTKTHLQRALGDENILIVKFEEEAKDSTNFATSSSNSNRYIKIAEEGILVGLRRYRLFGIFPYEALYTVLYYESSFLLCCCCCYYYSFSKSS